MRNTFLFAWRLLAAHPVRNSFVAVSVGLGTFFFTLFLAFLAGIERDILTPLETNLLTERLVITPQAGEPKGFFNPLQFFQDESKKGIPVQQETAVRALPDVLRADQEIKIPFPVATTARLLPGIDMALDSTLSGFSETAVHEFLPAGQSFRGDEDVLPVLMSPFLVEIYNSTIVQLVPGIESKTLDDFLGRSLEFTFGEINYLQLLHHFPADTVPQKRQAKIVGFAPFLSPFTLAIPEETARYVREKYEHIAPEDIRPHALLISPRTVSALPNLEKQLQRMGFQIKNLADNLDTVQTLFLSIKSTLLIAAGVMLLIAFFFLITVLSALVQEARQSIGIWRALGMGQGAIWKIFFGSGILLAGGGILIGYIVAYLAGMGLQNLLPTDSIIAAFPTGPLFIFSAVLFVKILGGAALIVLGAMFFPARAATKISPLEALLR